MQDIVDQGFRYERKFLVEGLDRHQVVCSIKMHPGMFSEIYHPRFVNSLYLDSVGFDSYSANVTGVAKREKARIRWYGERTERISKPVLEFKIKRGFLGRKDRFPLEPIVLGDGFSPSYFRRFIRAQKLPPEVKAFLAQLSVVLLNRYHRSYYLSADKRFRITIDTHFEYFRISGLHNKFLARQADHNSVVVELKYGPQDDSRAEKITSAFPFRVTKNSKYVEGVERLWV
ncbi:MAG: hypothetical protein CME06_06375 [Gemmatimonadetes bacterium]|nr:hypothetical protein [Gemmatimonadota bacterium]